MNDYTKNIQFMDNMIARMKELGIDLYQIGRASCRERV